MGLHKAENFTQLSKKRELITDGNHRQEYHKYHEHLYNFLHFWDIGYIDLLVKKKFINLTLYFSKCMYVEVAAYLI